MILQTLLFILVFARVVWWGHFLSTCWWWAHQGICFVPSLEWCKWGETSLIWGKAKHVLHWMLHIVSMLTYNNVTGRVLIYCLNKLGAQIYIFVKNTKEVIEEIYVTGLLLVQIQSNNLVSKLIRLCYIGFWRRINTNREKCRYQKLW